ncbi:hypothetical protein TNCV_2770951 [Trichonephila clavipes]|nr:hypothetical protein TNCV_2770951 [Trichonephila clavipes]
MANQLEIILVLKRAYKKFVSDSTGTMCGVIWKSVVAHVIHVRKDLRKRTRGRLQLYNVGVSFERIAFDILG